jgi:hypothetical protein
LHNNHEAGVDVRKIMQDLRLLSYIIRDQVTIRGKSRKGKVIKKDSAINIAIKAEENRLKREDEKIIRLEKQRKER